MQATRITWNLADVDKPSTEDASETGQARRATQQAIAEYAARHGGGSQRVDLDADLEAASVEHWLNIDK